MLFTFKPLILVYAKPDLQLLDRLRMHSNMCLLNLHPLEGPFMLPELSWYQWESDLALIS